MLRQLCHAAPSCAKQCLLYQLRQTAPAALAAPHSAKQDFTLLVVLNGAVVQVEVYVPGFTQKTASYPPVLIGVTILHDLGSGMSTALSSPLRTLKHLKSVLRTPTVRPLLGLRALFSYGVSKIDYLAQSVLIPEPSLAACQVAVNSVVRFVHNVPRWLHQSFLYAPLDLGGCGGLADRAVVRLASTYASVAYSRNPVSRAAVVALLQSSPLVTEGRDLRDLLWTKFETGFHVPWSCFPFSDA